MYNPYSLIMRNTKLLYSLVCLLMNCLAVAQPRHTSLTDLGTATALPSLLSLNSQIALPEFTNAITFVTVPACPCLSGCGPITIPLTLLSFEAQRTDIDHVLLKWKTTNELSNKGFDVERSLGNTKHFEKIDFVPAQINAAIEKEYKLTDNNNYSGTSYYRLKQIDLDGKLTYSPIRAVRGYIGIASLSLYPNPVQENLVVDMYATLKGSASMSVFDASLKLVYSRNVAVNKGINLFNIPVAALAGGMYFLRIISAESTLLNGKFVKW